MSVSTSGKPVFVYMPAARGDSLATSRIEAERRSRVEVTLTTTRRVPEDKGRSEEARSTVECFDGD